VCYGDARIAVVVERSELLSLFSCSEHRIAVVVQRNARNSVI